MVLLILFRASPCYGLCMWQVCDMCLRLLFRANSRLASEKSAQKLLRASVCACCQFVTYTPDDFCVGTREWSPAKKKALDCMQILTIQVSGSTQVSCSSWTSQYFSSADLSSGSRNQIFGTEVCESTLVACRPLMFHLCESTHRGLSTLVACRPLILSILFDANKPHLSDWLLT